MDNFYVMLPSNVKSFPQNTISNYRTKLASRLILTDDWEVGLVEISYTLSWYNIPKKEPIYLMYLEDQESKKYVEKVHLLEGRYDTIDQAINSINKKLSKIAYFDYKKSGDDTLRPQLEVAQRDRLITISQRILKNNKCVFVLFSDNLCDIFGFDKHHMAKLYANRLSEYAEIELEYIKNKVPNQDIQFEEPPISTYLYTAEKPYELSGGYHSLFVYSDIVSPSFVGDSYTQLLRIVEIPSNYKFGDQVKITYPNTYYVPVLVKEFETIEIDIKDDSGENIPFQFGRSIITLHFRKVNKRNENLIF